MRCTSPRRRSARITRPSPFRLNNLAALLWAQGDSAQARPLYERALRISESSLGPTHPDVAVRLNNLAMLLKTQGEPAKARPLYERALKIDEARLGPDHPGVAVDLNNLAGVLRDLGDDVGARALYERALRINERALGPDHPTVAGSLNNLALVLKTTGDLAGARRMYERAVAIHTQILGPAHPTVGIGLGNLAALLWAQRDHAGARSTYERARRVALAVGAANADLDDGGRRGLLRPTIATLRDHAELLAEIAREPRRDPSACAASSEAFVVAEQARAGAAQAALARAGARAAAGKSETADLARELQLLREQLDAARKQLLAEYGRSPDRRDPGRLASAQQSVQRVERDLQAIATRLRTAFPGYAQLASPEPIDVADARRLLRRDEALVSYLALDDRVLSWLLRPGRPAVYRDIRISRADLVALVKRVRASLDQSANAELSTGRLAPFDVAGAHQLYRLLLGPVSADLAGIKHLIAVPDDPLLAVPFGVLLTSPAPAGPIALAAYPKLSWLARQYAVTVRPSATALRALRQTPRARAANVELFVGFGDPVLAGFGGQRGGAMVSTRSAGVDAIRRLSALPGTRDELLAIARALGAEPSHAVFLGPRATKPQLMALDAAGRLARTRVLSFATHGLLAGGSGESLSGLARAFFFAGAPTLLVSHWSVDDAATSALMTQIFERYAKIRRPRGPKRCARRCSH